MTGLRSWILFDRSTVSARLAVLDADGHALVLLLEQPHIGRLARGTLPSVKLVAEDLLQEEPCRKSRAPPQRLGVRGFGASRDEAEAVIQPAAPDEGADLT